MMDHHFKCTLCGAEYDRESVRYVCPRHGDQGVLDTILDYSEVARRTTPERISDSRDYSVWRYAPLLPVDDAVKSAPSLQVGWTPLYRSTTLGPRLGLGSVYFKDEGRNPTASLKDRASAVVVARARELGVRVITTASTGNAGAALAGLAAAAGMPAVIFVPRKAPPAKIAQLLVFGARVLLVEGTYDQAFDLCLEATKSFGWYCRNTAYNPYTVEGKKTAAFEICEQLTHSAGAETRSGAESGAGFGAASGGGRGASGRTGAGAASGHGAAWQAPDRVFVSVGDGNIVSGLWKGFRDLAELGWIDKMPKLMGVQAEGSAACHDAWKAGTETITRVNAHTVADSISADLPRDGVRAVRAVRETGGAYLTVTDDEILAAIPELARGEGVFVEPAASAAYAGLKKAVELGLVESRETIVCLLTGNGLKDVASAMKTAGAGTVIEPSLDAVRRLNLE